MRKARNESVFGLLARAHAIAVRVARDHMMELGVSPIEAWLLDLIPENGRVCATTLAKALDVPTSTVTRALRRMEKHDYVTLTKGFHFDARVLRPKLTPTGIRIRDGARGFEHELDQVLLDGMHPNALGPLLAGLIRVVRNAERLDAEVTGRPPPPDDD